ncbi:Na+/H+ antiporter subunit A [Paenibacillus donghaensis]|uniref:Na+/H+ antiporter subunit A n=1 Tax=Paenibacillus donghaensis TaxID=414771 RepID=A0A2Z2K572_9BACL|nr:Na+/H+ antiporter subunit A [Paenibacillus donghaensis]ASA21196.1 Na+/H+ antiporter subunit A [Paenibacillus donghaensis]
MPLLHVTVLVPFLLALLIALMTRRAPTLHRGWLVIPGPLALFIYFLTRIPVVRGGDAGYDTISWIPSLGIDLVFHLDGLSLLFTLLITGMGTLVVIYSIYYLDRRKEELTPFYIYLLLFMGAMLGVVLSDNLMVLYGFWELTSVSSFLLIAFWHRRQKSRYGAQKSMLITVFGGLAMFAGFLMLYVMTGTFSIREIWSEVGDISGHMLFIPAMLLILLGAFTKSAQFPFHIWLPDAMEAPTPVSAYLHSATMVKAGLYLVARFSPIFAGQHEWFWIVSGVGLITLIYGSIQAMKQTDLKALLAYSTISQLGLIMGLLGMGSAAAFYTGEESVFYTAATTAALFHLINHAIFKGSLFMVVGIVDHETNTRDLRKLGGLISLMPVTFTLAMIGSFSMAGLPPFAGFLSKEMFFTAVLNIRQLDIFSIPALFTLFPLIAWIASIFTFAYSMILVFNTFFGKYQPEKLDKKPHEAPFGLLLPPLLLAVLSLVFGFIPNILSDSLIIPAMNAIHPIMQLAEPFEVNIHFWHGWTPEVWMTLGVVVLGIVVYRLYGRWSIVDKEWGRNLTLNDVYDGGIRLVEQLSRRLTGAYMTGSMRHYLMYIFSFLIVAIGGTMLYTDGITLGTSDYAPISFFEVIVVAVMLTGALAIPFTRSRIAAILFTGMVGYMVTLLFVLFRAPDLALTQMIVEVVSVALFLLCFRHLPKLKREPVKLRSRLPKLLISIGIGITMTLVALAALGSSPFESISSYYVENSYTLGGGKNIVNVLLVDFRGFDTMFEITVLGVASLAIYSMIKLQLEAGNSTGVVKSALRDNKPRFARSNDVLLQSVAQVAFVIIITFSLYLFFAGHNHPGGGFIGALMASAALVLLSIAFGTEMVEKVLPINYRKLIAVGILLAFLTGVGSFLFGVPFLSQAFGYFQLPLMGTTELTTAMLFDLGVYLAVIGVTMNIIFTIGRDN